MHTKKIFLELTADGATVAVVDHGRVVHSQRLPFHHEHDAVEWVKSLRRFSSELKAFVEQHKLAGSSTFVVYQSPTSAVNLATASTASGSSASEVAVLGCLDALPYSALTAVVQSEVVGRDRTGDDRQVHVLVAAERDDVATAIVNAVQDAELKYISATPTEALICRRMAARALHNSGDVAGYLYVGEHSSHFMVGGHGRIEFERQLSFDIHSMVTTLRRPILRSGNEQAESIELELKDARRIAHTFGVPDRDAVVHEPIGLTGGQVIPLLQPLLQRLVVELRQSLRFGVSDAQRQQMPIIMSGPGVRVPNLADTLCKELGIEIVADESWQNFDFDDPVAECGELVGAIRSGQVLSCFNLQPQELATRRRTQRLKTWLWTGAAAALAIIAIDYLQYGARLDDARRQAEMMSIGAGDIEALRATSEKLEGTIESLTQLDQRITAETASNISFRALFNELTRVTPSSIRLTSCNFNSVDGQLVGRLNGYVFDTDGDGGQRSLESFIDMLRGSPLMSRVRLGDVQLGTINGIEGRRFDAEIVANTAPWQLVHQQMTTASASGDAMQEGSDR